MVGGDVYVAGTGARTLSTGGGTVTVNGEMLIANTSGLNINTQGGNVSFMGVLNSANQYDFIDKTGSAGTGSWTQARTEAIGVTGGGSAIGDTYLVTIGSRLENAVAVRAAGYRGAWIGAWRPSTSALTWTWANGPESGQNFFNQGAFGGGSSGPGGADGNPVNGSYQNFGSGEPNGTNSPTAEHVGQFFGTVGKWNDLTPTTTYSNAGATSQYAVKGFVRETNLAASPLTVNAGTGSVTFSGAVGNVKALATLNVTGSDVAINGGATTEGAQTYTATGAVTQGGALKANGLALLGTGGNYTLTNVANDVATLAADTGIVRFTNGTALTVGTVGATNGVTATGTVSVETQTGDMTIAQNIATADTSNAAIVLNAGKASAAGTATGGSVVLSGSPTLTSGTGGRTTIYSGSISGSTGLTTLVGSGSGNFRYNSDETTTNYTTALGTGLYAIYREQPLAALAIDDKTMVYGNTLPTLTGSVTGMVNGDASGALALTSPTYSGASQLQAGSYAITPASLAALGYGFTGSAGTLTVGQRTLTVGFTGVNKTYDGTPNTTVTTSDDRLSSDVLTIQRSATFADKNAGTSKTVNVTGVSLTGTDSSNYTVASTGSTTADITARTLNVTYTGVNKVYDGTSSATVTTSDDRLGSDVLTIQRTAAFTDKNASTGKTVNLTGVSLTGTDSSNYTVASTGSTTADITARTLNVTYTGVNKVYDGTSSATVTTSDDRLGIDALTIQRTAAFLDKNASTGKTVNVTGVSLTGTDAGNYTVATTTGSATADITARTLNVTYTGVNKVYDGTSSATVNTSDDRLGSDALTIQRTAAFLDKNASTGKTVNVTGVSLTGTDAGNYAVATTGSTTADITPRTLNVTYMGVNRVYDGTLTASVSTGDDRLGSDALTIQRTASFANKNVGTGKSVAISGVTLTGTDAGNYAVASSDSTTADITARTLNVTYTGVNKVYDGTSSATVTTSDNRVGSDALTIQRTAAFLDKNASTGKTVNVTGVSLTGTDAGNYTVATTGSTTADITPRTLNVTYTGVNRVYDGTLTASVSTSDDHLGSDAITIQRTAAFLDKNANTGKTVNVSGVSLTGTDAGNYTVATTGSTTADITPRTLNVTYTGVNRVYDGTLTASVSTSDDHLGSDAITIQRTAAFLDKNASAGKTVDVTGISLTGTDAGNYTVATTGSTTADITPRTLNITYTGVNKPYDGLTAASVTTSDNRVNGDTLTIQRNANFLDPNVGPSRSIIVNGVSLSGADAGDYILMSTTGAASANITPQTNLESAIVAPQQLPQPQPTLPSVTATPVQAPADLTALNGTGSLKMVYVNSEPTPTATASPSASNAEGGREASKAPAAPASTSAGLDPFGYVRVFVVRGGVNLPAEAQPSSDKPAR